MISATLKILSVNCQGLRDLKKCTDVLNYLTKQNPDILCHHNTHWVNDDLKSIKKIWTGECFRHGSRTNSRGGVIILIGKNKLKLNPDKTEFIVFGAKDRHKWLSDSFPVNILPLSHRCCTQSGCSV